MARIRALLILGVLVATPAALLVWIAASGRHTQPRSPHPTPTRPGGPNGQIMFEKVVATTTQVQGTDTTVIDTDEIFVVNADGTGLRQITSQASSNIEPSWSPDGQRIAFTEVGELGSGRRFTNILVMDPDGSRTVPLTHCREVKCSASQPVWSPDGSRIAFSWRGRLALMNADGSDARIVCSSRTCLTSRIVWSRDGRWIEFVRETDGVPGYLLLGIRPDGTGLRLLSERCFLPLCFLYTVPASGQPLPKLPAWSPDGRWLAPIDAGAAVASADGLEVLRLDHCAGPPVVASGRPAWSPDSGSLALVGRTGREYSDHRMVVVFELGARGSCSVHAVNGTDGAISAVSWQPG